MTLDISTLPAPLVIEPLDFEAILSAMRADLVERHPDIAPVLQLESAIVNKVMQVCAYRELLLRARVNYGLKAILPAFAVGSDLDAIAARLGVKRANGETDVQFLERYLVALARPSAGSHAGYLARVLEAWPERGDVAVLGPETHNRRGDIDVILAARSGAAVSSSVISSVRAAVTATDAKPLTDVVAVRAATIVQYQVKYRITVEEGRHSAPILAAAVEAAKKFVAARYQIGMSIKRSAIIATGYVAGVVAVDDLTSGDDVSVTPDQVPWCNPASINIQVMS